MLKKFLCLIFILLLNFSFSSGARAEDLIDTSRIKIRESDNMNMSGLLPKYFQNANQWNSGTSGGAAYDLTRMRQMNPDFTTYPEAHGIVWLKHTSFSNSEAGGLEISRLFVILGRRGLDSNWLNWNIQIPENGSTEIVEASVYEHSSGAKISNIQPELDSNAGIYKVNFIGLPDTFILVLSWVEHLPEELSTEGFVYFQEDLPVWESIVEVITNEKISYKTFPDENIQPEVQNEDHQNIYTWRRINVDPYNSGASISRTQKSGVLFSTRQGKTGLLKTVRDFEDSGKIPAPSNIFSGIKKGKPEGILKLITWLKSQPEIKLAEGTARKIPARSAWSGSEKIILARSWLKSQGIEAVFNWEFPFEPDDKTPLCKEMFYNPVIEVPEIKNSNVFDMFGGKLLGGAKLFSVSSKEEKFISRKIPSSKAGDNKLSAIMDLSLNENGMLNGKIRVIMRGAWGTLLLNEGNNEGQLRGALLALFPGLSNYKNIKYLNRKGVPEISFNIENKPGISSSTGNWLALLPFFEPLMVRSLANLQPPIDLRFPFVLEQEINLALPKKAERALVDGKVDKSADKINYSEFYNNRRHRLIASSRLEVNMPNIPSGSITLLRRSLEQWRNFSMKPIAVR